MQLIVCFLSYIVPSFFLSLSIYLSCTQEYVLFFNNIHFSDTRQSND